MHRKLLYLLSPIALLAALYWMGPTPAPPQLPVSPPSITFTGEALDAWVKKREAGTPYLKTGNEARIVWFDSTQKGKTPISMVYIHGFSASGEEGAPVHENLARSYGANLYIARLAGHGIDRGDDTMVDLTADQLLETAEEALAIGKQLGEEVVIVGTSMGGALTTYLAANHPEVKAIVLYSPCVEIFDPNAALIDNPWGLYLAKAIKGSDFNDIPQVNEAHQAYWSLHYRLEGVQALQNFLTHLMVPSTFEQVKCPVYMGYYYQNEENQDKVVSVPAMLRMFDQLGSVNKKKEAFPTAKNHVLASYVLSQDIAAVEQGTVVFLNDILLTSSSTKELK